MHRCLITGGSRGIGFAVSKLLLQHLPVEVLVVSRTALPDTLCSGFDRTNSTVIHLQYDLADEQQLKELATRLKNLKPSVSLLVNNAAIYPIRELVEKKGCIQEYDDLFRTMHINFIAPALITQAVLPQMIENSFGRIVNVSSGMSRAGEYGSNGFAYRASKRALNGLTLSTAYAVKGLNISCTSVCPGWVRTDMGGASAIRTPEDGSLGIIWALLSLDTSISGGFFRDDKPLSFECTTKSDYFDSGVPKNFKKQVLERAHHFKTRYPN